MKLDFDRNSVDDYQTYLKVRRLPKYRIVGSTAEFPDEYAGSLGIKTRKSRNATFEPSSFCFDYQRDIASLCVRKKKFAVFADCGLGKTIILLEFARHCLAVGKRTLIVSPLMVCEQTQQEAKRFYGVELPVVPAAKLQEWLDGDGEEIAITNYEAIRDDITAGNLGALILDESSMLKSMYGKFGLRLIELGKGLEYKLCLTGTPAPNDRIEYGNHAVFLDVHRTTNEFLAKYFINRGQTQERWELRPHALKPFYRDLSHWCIFLSNPAVYGWKDNCGTIPPINVHIHHVELTEGQRRAAQDLTGGLFVKEAGGIGQRGKLSQISKGVLSKEKAGNRSDRSPMSPDGEYIHWKEPIGTLKYEFIRDLINSWDASTLVWCHYNDEQDAVAELFGDCASIDGSTPYERRRELLADFKARRRKTLISKPRVLGYGLNLQVATKQVFSGLQDSYEEYYQAVKRSNRIGSTQPLDVHIPVTELEEPMVQNVLRKAARVQQDTEEQERLFKEIGYVAF